MEMPMISVVMAVYRPDPSHLEAQLNSLRFQDDPYFELVVRDDSVDEGKTAVLLEQMLTDFPQPVRLLIHTQNQGSTRTFEALTRDAAGDLIAYCDHDDIWEPDKLSCLRAAMTPGTALAYCNMRFINAEGALLINEPRPSWKRRWGLGLDTHLAYYNFVTGCAMMIRRDLALAALPFPATYFHDHWLALNAARAGAVSFVKRPLIKYRLHQHNQIGIDTMPGIWDKASYIFKRLLPEKDRVLESLERFQDDPEMFALFRRRAEECEARLAFMQTGNPLALLRFLRKNRVPAKRTSFEVCIAFLPASLGPAAIMTLRRWLKRKR
jgi:glycosyltransferase involved in cell wall biosynthesis